MAETIRVRPWPDPVIDTLGHDPRSLYVETFWLATLGPTALLLLRYLARRFEEAGALDEHTVIELPVAATAQALGVGPREGRNSPLVRTFERLIQFNLAVADPDGTLAIRRSLPPINRRHVRRLPPHVRAEHEAWQARGESPRRVLERRAKRVAFTLAELGTDTDVVERALHHLGYPPLLCRETAAWADSLRRAIDREMASVGAHPSHQPPPPPPPEERPADRPAPATSAAPADRPAAGDGSGQRSAA